MATPFDPLPFQTPTPNPPNPFLNIPPAPLPSPTAGPIVPAPTPAPLPPPAAAPIPSAPTPTIPSGPGAVARRSGGRIAGGFFPRVAPPGIGGFIFRRAIPGVSWLLLAYDLYQLGCQLGLLGDVICPNPRSPLPGSNTPFQGGQCRAVRYFVQWKYSVISPPFPETYHQFPVWGPVYEVSGPYDFSYSNSNGYRIYCHGPAEGQSFQATPRWVDVLFTTNSISNLNHTGVNIIRADGLADECGDPPPTPTTRSTPPNVINITNNTNNNITIITPPKLLPPAPIPKLPPIIIRPPSPLPIPYDAPDPQPTPQPQPQPNSQPTPQPQPNFPQPTGQPSPTPLPVPTPTPQPTPVPPPRPQQFDFDKCDPCSLYAMRGIYEILDKLYKINEEILEIQQTQKQHTKILENIQKLVDVEFEGVHTLKSCDDIDIVYSYKGKSLTGLNKHVEQLEKMNSQLLRDICEIDTDLQIAAPDWWQVRLGGNVPQIAIVYRRVGHSNYYSLTVPHPKNTTMPSTSPLPAYTKGNFQGMIICIDNSKFICNCVSPVEADRMCNLALQLINPNYLESPPRIHISERKGQAVSVDSMLPRACMYYPTGQQNFIPEWRVAFNINDPIEQA